MGDNGVTLFAVLIVAIPSLLVNTWLYLNTKAEADKAIETHALMLKILRQRRRR